MRTVTCAVNRRISEYAAWPEVIGRLATIRRGEAPGKNLPTARDWKFNVETVPEPGGVFSKRLPDQLRPHAS
jgi:hypothetical protein